MLLQYIMRTANDAVTIRGQDRSVIEPDHVCISRLGHTFTSERRATGSKTQRCDQIFVTPSLHSQKRNAPAAPLAVVVPNNKDGASAKNTVATTTTATDKRAALRRKIGYEPLTL
jgi:hypothetical protein